MVFGKAQNWGLAKYPASLRTFRTEDRQTRTFRKILIRALKQSQRHYLPILRPMTAFQEFIQQQKQPAYLAHCNPGSKKGIWELGLKDLPLTFLLVQKVFNPAEIEYASLHKHQCSTWAVFVCVPNRRHIGC